MGGVRDERRGRWGRGVGGVGIEEVGVGELNGEGGITCHLVLSCRCGSGMGERREKDVRKL